MSFIRWAFPSAIAAWGWFDRTHTISGKACVITVVIGSLAAFTTFQVPLDLLAALTAIAIVCGVTHWLFRPTCGAEIRSIDFLECAVPCECDVVIKNQGFLPVFDMDLAAAESHDRNWQVLWPASQCLMLARQQQWLIRGRITGLRRGVLKPPSFAVQTRFPLSLFRSQRLAAVQGEITVLPYRPSPPPDWLLDCASQIGLNSSSEIRADGLGEFAGNAEFRPGMAVRKWDYRTWARLGWPVVRQYDESANRQVTMIVDTHASNLQLERLLSLAATIVDICSERHIDILALSTLREHEVEHNLKSLSVDACLDKLARVQAPKSRADHDSLPTSLLEGTLALILLPCWDQQRAELVRNLRRESSDSCFFVLADENDFQSKMLPSEVLPIVWKLPAACEECL